MCGRYAQALRPSQVRRQLQEENMIINEAPEDNSPDAPNTTHNFAPTNQGLVCRANSAHFVRQESSDDNGTAPELKTRQHYKLQTMKWGLIPSWTKHPPDYKFTMRTINCRSDSLAGSSGMWTSIKTHKRCIVIAQGFFEWLNRGTDKVPHYVKRKDGKLLCMAGLWDCTRYEAVGSPLPHSREELYTYTIVTTNSNPQLRFLHDRMPVILDPGSDALQMWLDLSKTVWEDDLQNILRPFNGKLEVYPVTREVGKVGKDSPMFVVPVNSWENKSNIANFFQVSSMKKEGSPTTTSKLSTEESSLKAAKTEPSQDPGPPMDSTKTANTVSHKRFAPNEPPRSPLPPSKKCKTSIQHSSSNQQTVSATQSSKLREKQTGLSKAGANKGHAKITSFFGKS
ncbi:Embryonic stem cell-specific 5-hydroxymethylcytosine-binding protein [Ceratocystis fimbriata CBS 114723]|uniref:Embryonic stem cell-specific 5-hydroxymethylcytosine-binding protein n=1 Tax=Ceratocystis fimbriata CBS 114723 TaxID=1035309 RepID=A0A2C5WVS6_9PEZI|nr:Embryonic stem cell-specific 5-hydroxymethylcytosine-binding protein [Ceratocystis fimbriata CBS 114723]